MNDKDKLQLDYEETIQQYRMLADTRFKLLAFVPTVSGLAVALLTGDQSPETTLAVGLLGFLVTLGILFYELRNSKFYDATIHRAKCLEARLELPLCTRGKTVGGVFNERPGKTLKLFGVSVWHDRGLALIYGAALGGWIYLIVDALLALFQRRLYVVSLAVAAVFAALLVWEFHRLEQQDRPQPITEDR